MRVLVAEDSATMRRFLTIQLTQWQYEVTEAVDGESAWELFRADPFPLVLTDWMMPGVDGLELIRRIRAHRSPRYVYLVLLTAKSEKTDLVEAMESGADDFLAKPFDNAELRVRLREGARIVNLERTLADQNRRLRETQAQLVQTEKLASLGQLAAGMAHEINNPLAYVGNNLAVLRRDMSAVMEILAQYRAGYEHWAAADPAAAAAARAAEEDLDLPWVEENLPRLFKSSLDGLARVRDIVRNLREFAHLDKAEWGELELASALQSTLKVLQHELEKKQLVVRDEIASGVVVWCQPGKIHQVFHNLLINAVQASDAGGTIAVRARQSDEEAVVEIVDYGCGIDREGLSRIFEPFYTTRPVGQGAGLGLAIAYGIVRDHGGSIEVDSAPGAGATFRVRLPRVPRRAAPPSRTAPSSQAEQVK